MAARRAKRAAKRNGGSDSKSDTSAAATAEVDAGVVAETPPADPEAGRKLLVASRDGDLEAVKTLVGTNATTNPGVCTAAQLNQVTRSGMTALHYAALGGHAAIVTILCCSRRCQMYPSGPALYEAMRQDAAEEAAAAALADVDGGGGVPFAAGAGASGSGSEGKGDEEGAAGATRRRVKPPSAARAAAAEARAKAKAKANARSKAKADAAKAAKVAKARQDAEAAAWKPGDADTPLHLAASNGHTDAIKALLSAARAGKLRDNTGHTMTVAELILAQTGGVTAFESYMSLQAELRGPVQLVVDTFVAGMDDDRRALARAHRTRDCMHECVAAKPNVRRLTVLLSGRPTSPLKDRPFLTRRMANAAAEPMWFDVKSTWRAGPIAPIHLAAWEAPPDIVAVMLADKWHRFDPLLRRAGDGRTTLHLACSRDGGSTASQSATRQIVDMFVSAALEARLLTPYATSVAWPDAAPVTVGQLLWARDGRGRTPLHYACMYGNRGAVEVLIGVPPEQVGPDLYPLTGRASDGSRSSGAGAGAGDGDGGGGDRDAGDSKTLEGSAGTEGSRTHYADALDAHGRTPLHVMCHESASAAATPSIVPLLTRWFPPRQASHEGSGGASDGKTGDDGDAGSGRDPGVCVQRLYARDRDGCVPMTLALASRRRAVEYMAETRTMLATHAVERPWALAAADGVVTELNRVLGIVERHCMLMAARCRRSAEAGAGDGQGDDAAGARRYVGLRSLPTAALKQVASFL